MPLSWNPTCPQLGQTIPSSLLANSSKLWLFYPHNCVCDSLVLWKVLEGGTLPDFNLGLLYQYQACLSLQGRLEGGWENSHRARV